MTLLTRLDDFVVDRVAQPIVNKTGIEPGAAARSLLVGDAVFTSCSAMALYMAGKLTVASAFSAGLVIAVVLPMAWVQKEAPPNGLAPAARHVSRFWRPFFLSLAVFGLLPRVVLGFELDDLFSAAGLVAFTAALYLAACRKPPPKQAAERKAVFARAGAR